VVKKMDDNNLLDMEKEFRDKKLTDEIERLKGEVTKYQILLKEAGIEVSSSLISDEEVILVQQIHNMKLKSDNDDLTATEIKSLDILIKNLRIIRGQNTRVGRKSKLEDMSSQELMKELDGIS